MKDAGKKQENIKCINFPAPTTIEFDSDGWE